MEGIVDVAVTCRMKKIKKKKCSKIKETSIWNVERGGANWSIHHSSFYCFFLPVSDRRGEAPWAGWILARRLLVSPSTYLSRPDPNPPKKINQTQIKKSISSSVQSQIEILKWSTQINAPPPRVRTTLRPRFLLYLKKLLLFGLIQIIVILIVEFRRTCQVSSREDVIV